MSTHSDPTAVIFFLLRMFSSLSPNSGLLGGAVKDAAFVDRPSQTRECKRAMSSFIYTTPTERQLGGFNTLKTILFTHSYLVSEWVTDITVASVIFLSISYTLDGPLRAKYRNTPPP
ncbi:hypothetical protein EDC04DRAFT_2609843 [Pisolithus marmoratus]|nr:hypothetical protein EDC04DRAFT_2609843 [Pisolithus marmoratus]